VSYVPVMPPVRTALYLDFDNVFSGLMKLDPKLAQQFAQEPATWVERLRSDLLTEGERRWLVLRCYMNPAGSISRPDGSRLHFSRFRLPFTDTGFEVVDCPRLTHTKNGADIRLALDAVEALDAEVRYDEFVIASGDSDMTALLVRLRAADRRTTVVSPSDSAVVLGAIADRLIRGEEFLELFRDEPTPRGTELAPPAPVAPANGDAEVPLARFGRLVRHKLATAEQALHLANLGHHLRAEMGPAETTDGWAGHATLTKALQALELPGVRISNHFVWESGRHDPPEEAQSVAAPGQTPEPVGLVSSELRLPRLARSAWRPIHESLAAFARDHEFTLTEATRWARDRTAEQGVEVNRRAVTMVATGAAYRGCPLYRDPSPTADEIAEAFVSNVVDRARAADLELNDDDVRVIRGWFGAAS
jgi:hypothetical protein